MGLTQKDRSRVIILGQLIYADRAIFENQVAKDPHLNEEMKLAVLAFPKDPVTQVEKEVYGVLAWVKRHKDRARKRRCRRL